LRDLNRYVRASQAELELEEEDLGEMVEDLTSDLAARL